MNKYKKGIDVGASMPGGEKISPSRINSSNSNTATYISLLLFMAFVILTIAGVYIDNDLMTFFGLGIGVADSVITLQKNLREEE